MRLNPYPRSKLSPAWAVVISAVATLVANGIWRTKFHSHPALLVFGFFGWALTLAVAAGILAFVIERCEEHLWLCAVVILSVLGVSFALYGLPGMWSLIVCGAVAVFMGVHTHGEAQDEDDLKALGAGIREYPPTGLLDSFSAPLWKRLGLVGHQPSWIVRGERRGYEWLVIELLKSSTESLDVNTTVFMVRLPRKSTRWHLPGSRITKARQACVDDEWVYVAELGQHQAVRYWPHWLDIAINTADEVVRTASTHPVPRRHYRMQDGTQVRSSHPSWNPHDGSWVFLWASLSLLIGGFVLLLFIDGYLEWQRSGMITRGCNEVTHMGTVLTGWKVGAWFGMLAVPLLGIGRVVHTLVRRAYKPGFALQINLEGIVLLGVTFGLAHALSALERSARAAC